MEELRLQSPCAVATAVPGRGSPSEGAPEKPEANSVPTLLSVRSQRLMGENPGRVAGVKGGFLAGSWGLSLALKTKKD